MSVTSLRARPRSAVLDKVRTPTFYAFTLVSGVLFLLPLVWAFMTSIKPKQQAASDRPLDLPTAVTLENYQTLWDFGRGFGNYLVNSLVVAAVTVLVTSVAATLAGYAFAKLRVPGGRYLFVFILAIIMIPFQTLLLSLFTVLQRISLYNSLIGLALVYATFQLPFSVFLMRNAFDAIPRELEEACLIDGGGRWRALWSVMLPIVRPAVVTVMLFAFLASWNEFFAALILLTDDANFTLPLVLMNAQTGDFGVIDWGAQQAGVAVTALPTIVIFLALQRFYIKGMTDGAIKA